VDSATFLALAVACAPQVHPTTAEALVRVESGFNPHAIGVVGGSLERQPRNLGEAIATAAALQAGGRNFSLGLAQINVKNLERLGLSLQSALDPCQNLAAMQVILAECLDRSGSAGPPQHALRRALSCYYSGNFVTGFNSGYVSSVVAASRLSTAQLSRPPP
jgi:type IV secretion system protein VirB1